MKFSLFAIVTITATTSSCILSDAVAATTASRRRRRTKNGKNSKNAKKFPKIIGSDATGPTADDGTIPIGEKCKIYNDDCEIPIGLEHGVCRAESTWHWVNGALLIGNTASSPSNSGICQDGQPGALCGQTSDCVIPAGLDHAVCRDKHCQSGQSSASCGQTSDCVIPSGLDHAVCRKEKCRRGVKNDLCGQNSDCLSKKCHGVGNSQKCK